MNDVRDRDDVLELLRSIDPVDADELARREVPQVPLQRILATPAAPAARRRPPRRRRAPRLALAGVAALLVGGVVTLLPLGQQGAEGPAARALEAVARTAGAQPAQAQTADYRYSRVQIAELSTYGDPPPFSLLERRLEERWVSASGGGLLVRTPLPPEFPSARDRERWLAAERPGVTGRDPTTERIAPGGFTEAADARLPRTDTLPTEPDALERVLRDAADGTDVPADVKTFELVGALLRQAGDLPELRAALFVVASRVDGVELVGETEDPLGRRGQAVAVTSDYSGVTTRELLIFDPRTAQLLASRSELLEPASFTGGPTLRTQTLVESGQASRLGRRPGSP